MRTLLLILGYLIADSALTDPCVNHTVLEDPWRSTDCSGKQCSGEWKCDDNLHHGWYRFKSSGGWKIPETVVPKRYCSTDSPGWLNGSHPTVGQGEVTRTVCFPWDRNPCARTRDIKIKNCSSYFVYELRPIEGFSAYCTDPGSYTPQEPEEQTTRESVKDLSSIPAGSASSDSGTALVSDDIPSTPEESSDSQTVSDEGRQCQRITVQMTSMFDLDEEMAKRIALNRLKLILKNQYPDEEFDLRVADAKCSVVDPPEE